MYHRSPEKEEAKWHARRAHAVQLILSSAPELPRLSALENNLEQLDNVTAEDLEQLACKLDIYCTETQQTEISWIASIAMKYIDFTKNPKPCRPYAVAFCAFCGEMAGLRLLCQRWMWICHKHCRRSRGGGGQQLARMIKWSGGVWPLLQRIQEVRAKYGFNQRKALEFVIENYHASAYQTRSPRRPNASDRQLKCARKARAGGATWRDAARAAGLPTMTVHRNLRQK